LDANNFERISSDFGHIRPNPRNGLLFLGDVKWAITFDENGFQFHTLLVLVNRNGAQIERTEKYTGAAFYSAFAFSQPAIAFLTFTPHNQSPDPFDITMNKRFDLISPFLTTF
jgi:hypothetical protein